MNPSLERAVELFVVINLAVIGLSHAVAPRAWVDWFQRLHVKGPAGVFDYAFVCLSFGSIVASLHSVWRGLPLVVTLIGWAQVGKGAIYFAFPAFGLKQIERMTPTRSYLLRRAGIVMLAITAGLGCSLFRR